MVKVEIVSRHIIKPSNPNHDTTYGLSYLDQLVPDMRTSFILYYTSSGMVDMVPRLKQSLSETLSKLYPLAGRLRGYNHVDCNDEGVAFYEAKAKGELMEVLYCYNADMLTSLLPPKHEAVDANGDGLFTVQVNLFECGGLAVGVSASHWVLDGWSFVDVINRWASTATGGGKVVGREVLGVSEMFPPEDWFAPEGLSGLHAENPTTKRFVLDSKSISDVRASSNAVGSHPSRVQAVTALLWRCMGKALTGKSEAKVAINMTVNIRSRLPIPPPPGTALGNMVVYTMTSPMAPNAAQWQLEEELRDTIKSMNGEYLSRLHDKDGFIWLCESLEQINSMYEMTKYGLEIITFSSWCNFPMYEADFGWGKPVWVSTSRVLGKNVVFLMERKDGDGMDAWVTMEEEDMARLEHDPFFLRFASKTKK